MTDACREKLRELKIKLWEPPYYGVAGASQALEDLAKQPGFLEQGDACLQNLRDLQSHALDKLKGKGKLLESLTLKILLSDADSHVDAGTLNTLAPTWAEKMTTTSTASNFRRSTLLVLERINPLIAVADFVDQLTRCLLGKKDDESRVIVVRLVHKGKTLQTSDTTALQARLVEGQTTKANVLCLVTHVPPKQEKNPDEVLLDSIQRAAAKLHGGSGTILDITDSAGNMVSMSSKERIAFLTALALHSLGKQKMQEGNHASALFFLLHADQAWREGPLKEKHWESRVDNFGLLQLDICWVYLQLESLDNLSDTITRLETAERVLRKQVNVNFVTLALVQADMDRPVPALSAMFVRLFLLQGVAYQHAYLQDNNSSNKQKSAERLDWAWGLTKSLRATSPPDAVQRLMEAVGATPFEAISALRRKEGNIDQAAALLQGESVDQERAEEERYKQRKLGLCENGQDYVNLSLVVQLKDLLSVDDVVAASLARLSNNNMQQALDLYQDRDQAALMQRISELDAAQGRFVRRKRNRTTAQVDPVALASLLSMGITDQEVARNALLENQNNVDMALAWLTAAPADGNNSASAMSQDEDASQGNQDEDASQGSQDDASSQGMSGVDAATSSPAPTSTLSMPAVVTPQQVAEEEATDLLEGVLGEFLQEQNKNEGCLGHSLDEEWGYVEQYRKTE